MSTLHTCLWSSAFVGTLMFALTSVAGCGDDGTLVLGDDSGSSSSGGASTPISVPTDATLRFTEKGGMPGPENDASTCQPADDLYTYDLASKSLTWKLCRALPSVPEELPAFAYRQGTVVVSAAQDAAIHTALDKIVRNTTRGCGADKPTEQLVVIAANGGETTYDDPFYHCSDDGKTYVDGLGALGNALDAATVPE